MKTEFLFYEFLDYENGKIACLEMTGDEEIPINIFIDNAENVHIQAKEHCDIDVIGIGSNIEVFASEAALKNTKQMLAPIALIPMGTFPVDSNRDNFEPSPHILFSGKVLAVEYNADATPSDANYCITVETLGMTFTVYTRYEATIAVGYIVKGVAWLFGDMEVHCLT
ncbi:hypothetical protein RFF05_12910 [Bengtsoniella intestinalis]|uniref:hypothetical protein n=1 Tax=Bengtsoniella intestinalis TaxID=3073143 RepID=UPI00391F9010